MYIPCVFSLMLISLHTTSCNRHGGLGMQKLGRDVSDGYDIWELVVTDDV
jgi:predicted small secreted protein